MKLFFETANQARVFLAVLPIGFALALCFDLASRTGSMRPVLDALCLLLSGLALVFTLLLTRDAQLRPYHFLALAAGALIYTAGVGRLARALFRFFKNRASAHRV